MAARKQRFCRHPRTTQESRMSIRDKKYVRAKRRKSNLPNAWDDNFVRREKSWKSRTKRKHQYRDKPREKCEICVDVFESGKWYMVYLIEEALENKGYFVETRCCQCDKKWPECRKHWSKKIVYWK